MLWKYTLDCHFYRMLTGETWQSAQIVAELRHREDKHNLQKIQVQQYYCLPESDESIDAYTTALHTPAETCEFGLLQEDLIRDCLVCGIRDCSLRKKLLQEPKLTLDKCLDSCQAAKATNLQMRAITIQNNQSSDINTLIVFWKVKFLYGWWLKNSVASLTKEIEESVPLTVNSVRNARNRIRSLASVIFMRRKLAPKKRNQRLQSQAWRKPFKRKCPLLKPISHRKRKQTSYWQLRTSSKSQHLEWQQWACIILGQERSISEFVVVDGNNTLLIGARAAQQIGLLVVQHHNIQLVRNNEALTTSRTISLTKEQVSVNWLCRHF